ncbi:MAG: TRAP transporter substrate-binding protein [Eubacterium sp.]|nr:TRAP transporter substrate-binding protein [Eubacterium sp.]
MVVLLVIGATVFVVQKAASMDDGPVVLVYSETNAADSIDGQYADYFKEKVEELTDGSVLVDVQTSGVLGSESDVLDGMISGSGTVDMARFSCYAFSNYGCRASALLGLPFVFESSDHFWKYAASDLGQEILEEPQNNQLGVSGLFYLEDGFRSFFFNKKVETIEDMKDMKLRVSSDQIMTGMVECLGASPTVVSFNELYTSLQSGVVDGAEQPIPQYGSNAFNEVAPYMLLDEHTLATSSVVIADEALAQLSDEQVAALYEAGRLTEEYCQELSTEEAVRAREELTDKGVTFIDVEDKTPYREACSNLYGDFIGGIEEKYEEIIQMAK